jgi:tight adherence protein B
VSVVAALVSAAAIALLLARTPQPDGIGWRRGQRPDIRVLMVASAVGLAVALFVVPLHLVILVAFGVVAAGLGSRLLLARRTARLAQVRADQVVLACEAMAGDLTAGLPPRWALARVARHWDEFEPVAVAGTLDADIPDALREVARLPGAAQLAMVAACWQVAHRSGAGLAESLHDVAVVLREDAGTRRLVEGELAAARVTARMMCALPVLVLLLAVGVGADPWHFLLATPFGLGCAIGGILFDLAGLVWMQQIADGVLGR